MYHWLSSVAALPRQLALIVVDAPGFTRADTTRTALLVCLLTSSLSFHVCDNMCTCGSRGPDLQNPDHHAAVAAALSPLLDVLLVVQLVVPNAMHVCARRLACAVAMAACVSPVLTVPAVSRALHKMHGRGVVRHQPLHVMAYSLSLLLLADGQQCIRDSGTSHQQTGA